MARSLTLVVPVFDGATFVASSLVRLHEWLSARDGSSELIVVDDGSGDRTPEVLAAFERDHDARVPVRVLTNPRNMGKGHAVRRGLLAGTGQARVFVDADLTYMLEDVGRVVEALERGADIAVGNRVHADSRYHVAPSFFRYIYTRHNVSRVFNALVRLTAVKHLPDTQAGLKGMTAAAAERLLPRMRMNRFSFDVELLHVAQRHGLHVEDVPVTFVYRKEPSTVQLFRDSLAMVRDIAHIRLRSARGQYDDAVAGASAEQGRADHTSPSEDAYEDVTSR